MGQSVRLRLSKMLKIVLGSILLLQVHSLPRTGQGKIDWSKIQPKRLSVDSWNGKTDLPQDVLVKKILAANEQAPESYTGYKKGTKSFAGDCGLPGPKDRIVGGDEATPHQYPWMAALFIDDKWFCGGTLISDEWVMTAGHCADDATSVEVMLGAHNDIALIKLPEPIEFN